MSGIGGTSAGLGPGMPTEKINYGKAADHRPAARDGHSGVIYDGRFVVFGGDRHHMPFNDLYMIKLN